MPIAALDAGPLEYEDHGPRNEATVLLVHGVLVAGDVWERVVEDLVAGGCRVVVPTLPLGCHRLAMPEAPLSPGSVAQMLRELVAHLDLSDVILVGNDTGGAICQFVVDQDPEPFGAMVLTSCDAFEEFPPRPFAFLPRLARRPRLLLAVYSAFRSDLVRRVGYRYLARQPLRPEMTREWWRRYFTDPAVRSDAQRFLASVSPAVLSPVTRRMASFERPVIVVWGGRGRVFSRALGRRLAGAFADAEFQIAAGAGDFVMWDRPDALVDAVTRVRART